MNPYTPDEIHHMLLSSGVFDPTRDFNGDINTEKHHTTLLGFAIIFKDFELCKYLVEKKADVNKQSLNLYNQDCMRYPIEIASSYLISDNRIVSLLLENGAIIDQGSVSVCNYLLRNVFYRAKEDVYSLIFEKVLPFATELDLSPFHGGIFFSEYYEDSHITYKDFPKPCKVEKLDVHGTSLNVETLTRIANFAKNIPSIKSIDISKCSLNVERLNMFLEILGNYHNITSIDLSNNRLFGHIFAATDVRSIINWLDRCSNIVDLKFDNSGSIGEECMISNHIKKKKNRAISLILRERMKNEGSPFYKDYLPLDIIKYIFGLAGLRYNDFMKPIVVKKRKCED